MPFDYAVRPYQTRDPHGKIIIPAAPGGPTRERATLTWKASAPGVIPTPRTIGVNVQCCNEVREQTGKEPGGAGFQVQGPNGGATFNLTRTDVVLSKKHDKDDCDKWLDNNSYVAAGVKGAFSDMASLIHASDDEFSPSGTDKGCKAKSTYKYDGG